MHGIFEKDDSLIHAGLGAATALVSPYLALAYGVYQFAEAQSSSTPGKCPNFIVQGVEYAIGYFGILLVYQTYTDLQY